MNIELNAPNILTLLRIGLIPIFVLVFYLPFSWSGAGTAFIFVLAALTDWLDGLVARTMGQSSKFGAFLDPVADKLMVAVALVLLVESNPTPLLAVPAAVIVGREIVISALREWMAEIGKRAHIAVSIIAKFKTFVQMAAITLLLYHEPLAHFPTSLLGFLLLYIAVGLTLWSMYMYLHTAWILVNASKEGGREGEAAQEPDSITRRGIAES